MNLEIRRRFYFSDDDAIVDVVSRAWKAKGGLPLKYRGDYDVKTALFLAGFTTFVAEVDGKIVGCGQVGRAFWASKTWFLCMGAVEPAMQGLGIGHALVLARLNCVAANGGGVVWVSAKNPMRWLRYGFRQGPLHPQTGAATFWKFIEPSDATTAPEAA